MAALPKIVPIFLLLILSEKSFGVEPEAKEELLESESKDGKLEIIKQIKKVNDDGSYTIGYEADDGSFKIESRDVLGNIKGTYGYIDDSGQIKRVSYSTSNSSEVVAKPESSVVQRIPKANRTITSPTKRPYFSTTQSIPTSTTALQRLAKLRSLSTTTEKPNYSEVVSVEKEIKTTSKPHLIYASSTPRILLQGRPLLRSTATTHIESQKSEGQLIRPDVTVKPTELPLFRRLALKQAESEIKPVEEPEIRSNILRRQLGQDKNNFDPQIYMLQQQHLGNDATDVYSASVTTGTPRPLFTTTARPRGVLSTTVRPTVRYQVNLPQNDLQHLEATSTEEATTAQASSTVTPTPVPVVQIPATRATQEPLVAIKHPFQEGTLLVPLSHLQRRVIPLNDAQYVQQTTQRPEPVEEPRPVYVRRLPPPQFRPIPVQVDENGYIREVPRADQQQIPYPVPIPVTSTPKYVESEMENDIENISPPVSTRDFQRLLQQLILRQTRLERISALTDLRRHPQYYQQPRYNPVYQPSPAQYYPRQSTGPVQFEPEPVQRYVQPVRQQERQEPDPYQQQSYVPTRRVARLLPQEEQRQEEKEEYLPPDVREMLLLRMLQLAINPALPLNEDDIQQGNTPVPQYKKVRNVEILGEENEDQKRAPRSKRYQNTNMGYYL